VTALPTSEQGTRLRSEQSERMGQSGVDGQQLPAAFMDHWLQSTARTAWPSLLPGSRQQGITRGSVFIIARCVGHLDLGQLLHFHRRWFAINDASKLNGYAEAFANTKSAMFEADGRSPSASAIL